MPIIFDARDKAAPPSKTSLEVKGDFRDKDLLKYESELVQKRNERIRLLLERNPHLKGLEIL